MWKFALFTTMLIVLTACSSQQTSEHVELQNYTTKVIEQAKDVANQENRLNSNTNHFEVTSSSYNETNHEITGNVTNNNAENYKLVYVDMSLFDSSNQWIGDIYGEIHNMNAGETKNFTADTEDLYPATYKIIEVRGINP